MKDKYTQEELDALVASNQQRSGWDFSIMKTERNPTPWDYLEVVRKYLKSTDTVLDCGTGGGENFCKLAPSFANGVGIDNDPNMIKTAQAKSGGVPNVRFHIEDDKLENTDGLFDVVLNRHSVINLSAIKSHLKHGGYFITQQVGVRNMLNVKEAINRVVTEPELTRESLEGAGFKVADIMEYDVTYIVKDVESLVFWLNALDSPHADFDYTSILTKIDVFNKMLSGNVDDRGFTTNEHRYLVVAQG